MFILQRCEIELQLMYEMLNEATYLLNIDLLQVLFSYIKVFDLDNNSSLLIILVLYMNEIHQVLSLKQNPELAYLLT